MHTDSRNRKYAALLFLRLWVLRARATSCLSRRAVNRVVRASPGGIARPTVPVATRLDRAICAHQLNGLANRKSQAPGFAGFFLYLLLSVVQQKARVRQDKKTVKLTTWREQSQGGKGLADPLRWVET